MNVVDSSAWLEYFSGGPNAVFFAEAIEATDQLIVPSICLFEVMKHYIVHSDKLRGLERISAMHRGKVIDLDEGLALQAAELSAQHSLAMADSLIFASARRHGATLWTQDADFKGLPGVKFKAKAA